MLRNVVDVNIGANSYASCKMHGLTLELPFLPKIFAGAVEIE